MKSTKIRHSLKLYPYGGFSVVRQRETARLVPELSEEAREYARGSKWGESTYYPEQCGRSLYDELVRNTLGLSSALNSHKRSRKRRGLKGFTSANKHRVKSGAYLLQRRWGRQHLTFLTATLPTGYECPTAAQWSEIVRQFVQKLKRILKQVGVWQGCVGVTEIQQQRFQSTGNSSPHLHLVFVGRNARKGWAISCQDADNLWRETLQNVFATVIPLEEVNSCLNLQRVKKEAYRYLGKYLSKGCAVIDAIVDRLGVDFVPTSWCVCTKEIKLLVDKAVVVRSGEQVTAFLDLVAHGMPRFVRYSKHLYHDYPDGGHVWIALYGELSEAGISFVRAL